MGVGARVVVVQYRSRPAWAEPSPRVQASCCWKMLTTWMRAVGLSAFLRQSKTSATTCGRPAGVPNPPASWTTHRGGCGEREPSQEAWRTSDWAFSPGYPSSPRRPNCVATDPTAMGRACRRCADPCRAVAGPVIHRRRSDGPGRFPLHTVPAPAGWTRDQPRRAERRSCSGLLLDLAWAGPTWIACPAWRGRGGLLAGAPLGQRAVVCRPLVTAPRSSVS